MSWATIRAKMIRKRIAAPAPKKMPRLRWRGGSDRLASAITTALSPESRMLIQAISPMPSALAASQSMMLRDIEAGKRGLQPARTSGQMTVFGVSKSQYRHNRA
jgi:hypothetical protein